MVCIVNECLNVVLSKEIGYIIILKLMQFMVEKGLFQCDISVCMYIYVVVVEE